METSLKNIFINNITKIRFFSFIILITTTLTTISLEFIKSNSYSNLTTTFINISLLVPVLLIEWLILIYYVKQNKWKNKKIKFYNYFFIILLTFSLIGVMFIELSHLIGFISYTIIYFLFFLYIRIIFLNNKNKFISLSQRIFYYVFQFSIFFFSFWLIITSIFLPLAAIFIKRPTLSEDSNINTFYGLNYSSEYGAGSNLTKKQWMEKWDYNNGKPPLKTNINFKIEENITNIYEWAPKDDPIVKNDKIVLFLHGLNGSRYSALKYMQMFYDKVDYKMLSFDMRGFGDNRKINRTFGVKEADDISKAFEKITKYYNPSNLVLYGVSNGGGSLLSFATKYNKQIEKFGNDKVNIIVESAYTSPFEEFAYILNDLGISYKVSMPQSFSFYKYLTGTSWFARNYFDESNNIKSPLLILHGLSDMVVNPQMAIDLTEKLQKIKNNLSSYILNNFKHVGISHEIPKKFMSYIKKFLNKNYEIDIETKNNF